MQLSISWTGETPWFLFRDPERTLDSLAVGHGDEVDNYRRYLRAAIPVASLIRELALRPPTPGSVLRHLAGCRGAGAATLLAWSRSSVSKVVRSFLASEALRAAVVTTGPAAGGSPQTRRGRAQARPGTP